MVYLIVFSLLAILVFFTLQYIWNKDDWKTPNTPFPAEWRTILQEQVPFYNALTSNEKQQFEYKVQEFLLNCRITGINTQVETLDKVLVAASAIIPIFGFKEWRYTNLYEVLLYPEMFNKDFEITGNERSILGMVGTGYMDGKMILSKQALRFGFANETDKQNTAIHEFIHLIDELDGSIDGIPSLLMEKQYTIPWLALMNEEIDRIYQNKSDINPYGGTNKKEFFAVAGEYFFERPKLLAKKHPELYQMLEKTFHQKMSKRNLNATNKTIGRNDPCPCESGLKFKHCCGKI